MKKLTQELCTKIQAAVNEYFYYGYDIFYLHGWFCAYLSSIANNSDDILIPTHLVLNEDLTLDEKKLNGLIDELVNIYNILATGIYDHNKLIKPLIDTAQLNQEMKPNLIEAEIINLQKWLYGYLSFYLTIDFDALNFSNEALENKFFTALFKVTSLFITIDKNYSIKEYLSQEALTDYSELIADIKNMWEGSSFDYSLAKTDEIVISLNDIYYVARVIDELSSKNNE